VIVLGDLLGNFEGALRIFDQLGWPSENNNYIFLGDYFNPEKFQDNIRIIIFFLYLKLNFPNSFFMLRGNHDGEYLRGKTNYHINKIYGNTVSKFIEEILKYLPTALLLNNEIYMNNGGIPHKNVKEIIENGDLNQMESHIDTEFGDIKFEKHTFNFLKENNLILFICSYKYKCGYAIQHDRKAITVSTCNGGYAKISYDNESSIPQLSLGSIR